jgi:hypothetical protein
LSKAFAKSKNTASKLIPSSTAAVLLVDA